MRLGVLTLNWRGFVLVSQVYDSNFTHDLMGNKPLKPFLKLFFCLVEFTFVTLNVCWKTGFFSFHPKSSHGNKVEVKIDKLAENK